MAPRLIAERYQLLREVSREQEATFWQATDTRLDRNVMLELMRPELADDAAAVERFRDSVRVTARGGRGPYGRLLDGGTDGAARVPFAVFEWVDTAPQQAPARAVAVPVAAPASQRRARGPRSVSEPKGSRNWALPVVLTCVPLAVGIIAVSRVLSTPNPPVANVFAVPTGTVQVGNPVVTQPTPVVAPTATTVRAVAATPAPSPRAVTPTPLSGSGERVQVANTDGIGVALRDGPGGQRLPGKGYDEGATVTVLERQGEWAHVRGDDGREGWVLAVTVPASGSSSSASSTGPSSSSATVRSSPSPASR